MRMADCHPERKHYCKRACRQCYMTAYRIENREAISAWQVEHRRKNREALLAQEAEYRKKNREAIAARQAKYNHSARGLEVGRRYRDSVKGTLRDIRARANQRGNR